MNMESNNALLQTVEISDFQKNIIYWILESDSNFAENIYSHLSTNDLQDIEYICNPTYTFCTPYSQEDFDEIYDFIFYNRTIEKSLFCLSKSHSLSLSFLFKNTSIGKFIVCIQGDRVLRTLNPK